MIFYRSIRARDLLEIFFVSAVTSLLAVRFYLYITGYPQVGGGGLHIAHMLWGGLLMLAGMTLLLAFIGRKVQQTAALVGGLGFGVFIDEIGKFITSDNDYFFKPTVGILYAIFVVLFFIFSYISRSTPLSSREYQLNALMELEEAVAHDMDEAEKARTKALLDRSDPKSEITKDILSLLDRVKPRKTPEDNRMRRVLSALDRQYQSFWERRNSNTAVRIFFIAEAAIFLLVVFGVQIASIDELRGLLEGEVTYGSWLLVGEIGSAIIAGLLALRGAYLIKSSRLLAFEFFKRAALVNIFLTQFFSFSRVQFDALPGFALNLVLIVVIGYAIHQERRLGNL